MKSLASIPNFIRICAVLLAMSLLHSIGQAQKLPYTIEDQLAEQEGFHMFATIEGSPDGKWIATLQQVPHSVLVLREPPVGYAGGTSHRNAGSHVVLVNTETGKSFLPFKEANTSIAPSFSPHSNEMAAYVQTGEQFYCLAIWDLETQKTTYYPEFPISDEYIWQRPTWTSSERELIALSVYDNPDESRDLKAKSRDYFEDHIPGQVESEIDEENARYAPRGALALFNLDTKKITTLHPYINTLSQWHVDNDQLIYSVQTSSEILTWSFFYELHKIDLRQGNTPKSLAKIKGSFTTPTLQASPNGQYVAYWHDRKLFVIDTESAQPKPKQLKISNGNNNTGVIAWSPDSQFLYGLNKNMLEKIDVVSGKRTATKVALKRLQWLHQGRQQAAYRQIIKDDIWVAHAGGLAKIKVADGSVQENIKRRGKLPLVRYLDAAKGAVYVLSGNTLQAIQLKDGKSKLLHDLRNPRRGKIALPQRQEISWTSPAGKKLKATVLLPSDWTPGTPIPTIIELYAGMGKSNTNSRVFNPNIFCSQGYAFVSPAMPLSKKQEPMDQIAPLVDVVADALIAAKIADPKKIGLLGQSYGGYSVLSTLIKTDRYAAGVALNGAADLGAMHFWGMDGWAENGQGAMPGPPWEHSEMYYRNSPYNYLSAIKTPIMLGTGGSDFSREQFLATYRTLKRLDTTPVRIRAYNGEGHAPGTWTRDNQIALSEHMLEWFDRYLR